MLQDNAIIQKVLDSNPLLEAFGNARTSRNTNSSRFGKYVKLLFEVEHADTAVPVAQLRGSSTETFLLEKSRVCGGANEGERTFHIFYQLLAAPESAKGDIWEEGLCGATSESFNYVTTPRDSILDNIQLLQREDTHRWGRTVTALHSIGIKGESFTNFMRTLCTVAQLGNITFSQRDVDDAAVIQLEAELDKLTSILEVEKDLISKAVTQKKIKIKGEEFTKKLTAMQARDVTDAFAKELYVRAFRWLTEQINKATKASFTYTPEDEEYSSQSCTSKYHFIGLLDIFGFEQFDTNGFEQICINHANEKLQKKFTLDIFTSVLEEYKSEGINLDHVPFDDNCDVLNLIEGKMGLIKLLNEECLIPKGNEMNFVHKLYMANATTKSPSSSALIQNRNYRRDQFGIKHYAGNVMYSATSFIFKNLDTLPDDVINAASTSQNPLIHNLLLPVLPQPVVPQPVVPQSKPQSQLQSTQYQKSQQSTQHIMNNTVWSQFKTQLNTLLSSIHSTKSHYVKCINPNPQRTPGVMDLKYSLAQLHCAGVVSAVRLSRQAFPNRLTFSRTIHRFRILVPVDWLQKMVELEKSKNKIKRSKRNISFSDPEMAAVTRGTVIGILDRLLEGQGETTNTNTNANTNTNNNTVHNSNSKTNTEVNKAFVCGKTLVYFKAGALEYLEAQRLKVHDRCATRIQKFVRQKSMNEKQRRGSSMRTIRRADWNDKNKNTGGGLWQVLMGQCWRDCGKGGGVSGGVGKKGSIVWEDDDMIAKYVK